MKKYLIIPFPNSKPIESYTFGIHIHSTTDTSQYSAGAATYMVFGDKEQYLKDLQDKLNKLKTTDFTYTFEGI